MSEHLITVRMNRGDSSPWGFRLQGGKDWGIPLAISKVNPNSLADKAGLQVCDYVIKIGHQSTEHMLHYEAQEAIKRSHNNLDLQVRRGSITTWQPSVNLIGELPTRTNPYINEQAYYTKTSLTKTMPESRLIGSKHNTKPKPFEGEKILVHKQFNSPLKLYSMDNIRETLKAHSEQIVPGVMGINFMKPESSVNRESEVYKAILEEEQTQKNFNSKQYDNVHGSVSPTIQSHAFRRLQEALYQDQDQSGLYSQNQKTANSGAVTKHVEAPVTKSGLTNQAQKSLNHCESCGGLITGVFCQIESKKFHSECFKCTTCGSLLKNIGYFNINDKLYCDTHAKQAASVLSSNLSFEPFSSQLGVPVSKQTLTVPEPKLSPPFNAPTFQLGRSSPTLKTFTSLSTQRAETYSSPTRKSPTIPPVAPKPQFKSFSSTFGQSSNIANISSYNDNLACPKFSWPLSTSIRSTTETVHFNSNVTDKYIPTGLEIQSNSQLASNSTSAPKRGRGYLQNQVTGSRIPICHQCSRPVRGPFIIALDVTWCPEHFICSNVNCRRSLESIGFVEEKGKLFCENCFEIHLAPICAKCEIRIKKDCLVALDKQWHPGCFRCTHCKQPFGNNQFFLENGQPYCEKDWNELFTSKCVSCGYPIEAGDRWVEALNNNYHSQCFKCVVCNANLEGQNFYAKGGRPFCKSHH